MKVRAGFVSNSSVSSFLVPVENIYKPTGKGREYEKELSDEEIKLLLDYGFRWTDDTDPFEVYYDWSLGNQNEASSTSKHSLCLTVSVNQDEVIAFLIKNNIPFAAALQYGEEGALFTRDSKEVVFARNIGTRIASTYQLLVDKPEYREFYDTMLEGYRRSPLYKVSVKTILEEEERYAKLTQEAGDDILLIDDED